MQKSRFRDLQAPRLGARSITGQALKCRVIQQQDARILDRRRELVILPLHLMNPRASQQGFSLARPLRALAWFLCMLVALWSATSRLVVPVASLASTLISDEACEADEESDCDPWEAEGSNQEAASDHGAEEIPTVADHRPWIAVFATSELDTAYCGKARPGFSSPEPRPAEQV